MPVVARPGETGAMTQPDAYDGYRALFDNPDRDFRNEVCGRIALALGAYMPSRAASRLACPVLVVTAGDDSVTPTAPAKRMAEKAPRGEHVEHAGWRHFDVYVGDCFEETVAEQTEFLARHLGA